jgi:hypothetical protein
MDLVTRLVGERFEHVPSTVGAPERNQQGR